MKYDVEAYFKCIIVIIHVYCITLDAFVTLLALTGV